MSARTVCICDGARTPIGRYGGSLSNVRADDLAAIPLSVLASRHPGLPVDDVVLGCANQAGEDNRNVARMALLLAGFPVTVPGCTVNRLCASGMTAVAHAAAVIASGDAEIVIAGGVEHMTRAPWVMPKPDAAHSRSPEIFDTTLGWRFVNPKLRAQFGVDSMGETAENVADRYDITREDQDRFAAATQERAQRAIARGRFRGEITPVEIAQKKGPSMRFEQDEFPRAGTTVEALGKLTPAFRERGTVTAGNSSGINDGACALVLASEEAVNRHGLTPRARWIGAAVAGVEPRLMGMGPVPATEKLLARYRLTLDQIQVIELNEAFAAQSLACLRQLGLADDDARVNPNGGAIALGHPLGMSGARLLLTALCELEERKAQLALCTMCVGVGQGMAALIERTS